MMLLPPKPGTCPVCAVEHDPRLPHNNQSLYYQYRFYGIRGRFPTWADAAAHCDSETRLLTKKILGEYWTEPDDGGPIADPPAESFSQTIGDPNSPGFGPNKEMP